MSENIPSFEITKEQLALLQSSENITNKLLEGMQLGELLQIKPETIAEMYSRALKMFKEEHYNDSLHAFLFLSFLDRNNYDIWLGLGMSLQMCKHFEAAIIAYELAAFCDVENPVPYFYLGKCLFAIHDHQAALDAIEMAIEFADGHPEYNDLLDQARTAKASLIRRQ